MLHFLKQRIQLFAKTNLALTMGIRRTWKSRCNGWPTTLDHSFKAYRMIKLTNDLHRNYICYGVIQNTCLCTSCMSKVDPNPWYRKGSRLFNIESGRQEKNILVIYNPEFRLVLFFVTLRIFFRMQSCMPRTILDSCSFEAIRHTIF